MIESVALGAASDIRHGFFTRQGGVSAGLYESLNCGFGSGDDSTRVARNRARAAERLGVAESKLVTAYQVHGVTVAEVTAPWTPGAGPRADAMVTVQRGVALGILTADCVPVLLADPKTGVIGAAHAGWKGAKAGVAAAVVTAMIRCGATVGNITAAVGPAIGAASYEVGPEFQRSFLDDDLAAARFFNPGPNGRPHFDLSGFVVHRLEILNIATVDRIMADTCADSTRFFSYRRSCLLGETDYGRQLSAIAMT